MSKVITKPVGQLPKRPKLTAVQNEPQALQSESKLANDQLQKDIEFAKSLSDEKIKSFFQVQTIKLAQNTEICKILAAEIKRRGLT